MHCYIEYSFLKEVYEDYDLELNPNSLKIKIDDKNNINYIKKKLEKINLEASNNDDLFKELNSYLDIATFVLSSFSSLSLIVSIIMISIIINITVLERTKEIGLLRSIGYSKKNINDIFTSEAVTLGLVIGLFSYFMSSKIIGIVKEIVNNKFDINLKTNASKYFIFGVLLSVLITMISSYFPSKKASNYDPINALKCE